MRTKKNYPTYQKRAYNRFDEERNALYGQYGRNRYGVDNDVDRDRDFEMEERTYSRDHHNTYSDNKDRYENRNGYDHGNSERGYENPRRYEYYEYEENRPEFGADYGYLENERFRSPQYFDAGDYGDTHGLNYGSDSDGRDREGNEDYRWNAGRKDGPFANRREYSRYGAGRNYGNGRSRSYSRDSY